MVDRDKMIQCARELERAHTLLDRASDAVREMPSRPQLAIKQGLLVEARSAVEAAKAALDR